MRKRKVKKPPSLRRDFDCHWLTAARFFLLLLLLAAWIILTAMKSKEGISTDDILDLIITLIVKLLEEIVKDAVL